MFQICKGCNKTFNIGPLFFAIDRINGISNSEFEFVTLSEEEADPNAPPREFDNYIKYGNPVTDRHLEHFWMSSSLEGVISNVSKGEELFTNYVYYFDSSAWKFGINDLRSQCHGEIVGIITQVEGMSDNLTSKAS